MREQFKVCNVVSPHLLVCENFGTHSHINIMSIWEDIDSNICIRSVPKRHFGLKYQIPSIYFFGVKHPQGKIICYSLYDKTLKNTQNSYSDTRFSESFPVHQSKKQVNSLGYPGEVHAVGKGRRERACSAPS